MIDLELNEFTGASLMKNDLDGDGMPDWWELKFAKSTPCLDPSRNDAAADLDRDGLCNLAEFVAGTDPTDPASELYVRIAPTNLPSGEVLLEWRSQPGRVYSVEWAAGLSAGSSFTVLQSNLVAAASRTNSFIWNTRTRPAGFLRVKVERAGGI